MALSVNTFETNPTEENLSFAFHEKISEGREIYFLAKFSPKSADPKSYAESVFGTIIDNFEDTEETNPYDIFEESLKLANSEMEKRKSQIKGKPEIVVVFFDFHNVYLSESGNSEVYLIREGTLSQITENNEAETAFSNILSGQIAVNDIMIIATSRILRVITTNQLVEMFERSDFSENISLLKQELRSKTNEDILISVVGVGKQEQSSHGGFLSKMVSKKATKKSDPAEIETIIPESKEDIPNNQPQEPEPKHEVEELKNTEKQQTLTQETENTVELLQEEPNIKNHKEKVGKNIQNILEKIKHICTKKNPQKKLIITVIAIGALFAIFMSIRVAQNYESEAEQTIKQDIQRARNAVKQANELLLQGDRKGANEMLQSAEELIQEALNSSYKDLRTDSRYVKASIEKKKLEAENAMEVKPQLIADLGIKNDNIQALGFNEIRGNLYVNDATQIFKTIRSIVENPVKVTNDEAIITSAARPQQDTIIFLTNTPRIIEYKGGVISPMNTKDPAWKKGDDLEIYGSRYIYILSPTDNQIWKYERRRADYSEGIPYNKTADLSQAISMAIDGSIYVLSSDGSIQKLMRGENEKYDFRDLPSQPFLGNKLKLYTSTENDFLYILDPDNSRILVFQKGDRFATYRKQVIFDIPEDAVDFQVNDSGQKVNLLTKDKIYEFDL